MNDLTWCCILFQGVTLYCKVTFLGQGPHGVSGKIITISSIHRVLLTRFLSQGDKTFFPQQPWGAWWANFYNFQNATFSCPFTPLCLDLNPAHVVERMDRGVIVQMSHFELERHHTQKSPFIGHRKLPIIMPSFCNDSLRLNTISKFARSLVRVSWKNGKLVLVNRCGKVAQRPSRATIIIEVTDPP